MATSTRPRKVRRFAPLDPSKANDGDAPVLKGIIFDVDGTLCLPQNYMFQEMRDALGIAKSVDILEHIHSLSTEPDQAASLSSPTSVEAPSSPQSRATESIRAIERRAMTTQRQQPGLQDLMSYLHRRNVRKALCTRNFPAPVRHLLSKFLADDVRFGTFEPVITRETVGIRPKPSPEGLWAITRSWGLDQEAVAEDDGTSAVGEGSGADPLELAKRYLGSGVIMVGDSLDDMAAGRRAGAATVLLVNEANEALRDHECTDLCIDRLDELVGILENGFVSGSTTGR